MEDIRYLSMPSIRSSCCSKASSDSPVSVPNRPMLTPLKTISRKPCSAMVRACVTESRIDCDRLRPRAMGMVQNEHE